MFPRRGDGLVIMTNGDNGGAVMGAVIQAVGRARGWPNSEPRKIAVAQVPRESLEAVVGRYADPAVSVNVRLDGGVPTFSLQGGPPMEIVPQGEDVFIVADMQLEIRFGRDPATGRVVSVSGAGVTLPRVPN